MKPNTPPQPPRPSAKTAYIGAALAVAALLPNALAEQGGGALLDLAITLGALATALGTLLSILGAVSAWLGLDRPCAHPRCRRDPATLDCANGRHDFDRRCPAGSWSE